MKKKADKKRINFELGGITFCLERRGRGNGIALFCDHALTQGGGWTALRTPVAVFWSLKGGVVECDMFSGEPTAVVSDKEIGDVIEQRAKDFAGKHRTQFKTSYPKLKTEYQP